MSSTNEKQHLKLAEIKKSMINHVYDGNEDANINISDIEYEICLQQKNIQKNVQKNSDYTFSFSVKNKGINIKFVFAYRHNDSDFQIYAEIGKKKLVLYESEDFDINLDELEYIIYDKKKGKVKTFFKGSSFDSRDSFGSQKLYACIMYMSGSIEKYIDQLILCSAEDSKVLMTE